MFDELSDITLIETPLLIAQVSWNCCCDSASIYWWYPALFISFITPRANGVIIILPLR